MRKDDQERGEAAEALIEEEKHVSFEDSWEFLAVENDGCMRDIGGINW